MSWSIKAEGTREAITRLIRGHTAVLEHAGERRDYENAKEILLAAVTTCPAPAVKIEASGHAFDGTEHNPGSSQLNVHVAGIPDFLV